MKKDSTSPATFPQAEIGREMKGSDAVVARSFGPPATTAECAAPLLRLGGRLADHLERAVPDHGAAVDAVFVDRGELTVSFEPADFPAVAEIMRPKRRRRLSSLARLGSSSVASVPIRWATASEMASGSSGSGSSG